MVVSSRWRERARLGAGIHQRETAGAVGALDHAGREAALADQRRLLIARHAGDGHRRAEKLRVGRAERAGIVAHLGQHRARHAEQVAAMSASQSWRRMS